MYINASKKREAPKQKHSFMTLKPTQKVNSLLLALALGSGAAISNYYCPLNINPHPEPAL